MLLRDSLADSVAEVTADLPALTRDARRRGTTLRRRRRAYVGVGSVAAAAVLGAGVWAVLPGADPVVVEAGTAAPSVGPLGGETATATSRGVAAALAAAVDDVADGSFGRFRGAAYDLTGYDHEAFASLLFEPDQGTGPAGEVFLNLQPIGMAGKRPYTCHPSFADCAVQQLPNGDTLRTYREDDDTEIGQGSRRLVSEVISPARRLRVIVFAMNTNPWAGGELRDRPVLSTAQLTEIAREPWWNRTELPVEYIAAGAGLSDYSDATDSES
ncbi:MAG TPA: hypothetical protein VMF51_12000 [Nocardioides sp.]|uniref:hypothetical protein n=1 Tax=Nocardioides sp. TaxID=35761 RepID=UPI002B841870|nr:hypothetical protein [Nocardioides sp.]HTW15848.1 hypothetical protein [Nocardioides sp.]